MKDGLHRSLHCSAELVHHLALHECRSVVLPGSCLLSFWQGSDIFLHERPELRKVNVTHNEDCRSGCILEQPAVILLDGLQGGLCNCLLIQFHFPRILSVESLCQSVLEDEVRSCLKVREHGLNLRDACLVLILVETRVGKLKV